jgi:hypothetical protein
MARGTSLKRKADRTRLVRRQRRRCLRPGAGQGHNDARRNERRVGEANSFPPGAPLGNFPMAGPRQHIQVVVVAQRRRCRPTDGTAHAALRLGRGPRSSFARRGEGLEQTFQRDSRRGESDEVRFHLSLLKRNQFARTARDVVDLVLAARCHRTDHGSTHHPHLHKATQHPTRVPSPQTTASCRRSLQVPAHRGIATSCCDASMARDVQLIPP